MYGYVNTGVKTKPITVRASGFRMPSPALQTEFAAILAENFKKDSTFHSQNSMPLTLQSDPNATSFSPQYLNSNNNTLTLATLNEKQSLPRALQRPFSSTISRRDDNGNGDNNSSNNFHNNNNNNNSNNNNHGHASAYSTRKLVAAKEKSKKVSSP